LGGFALSEPPANPPGRAPAPFGSAAAFLTKDKLLVAVMLTNPESRRLQGRLRLEILGSDGQTLVDEQQPVRPKDGTGSYRFELRAPQLPIAQLHLRCRFQEQQFTVPLSRVVLVKGHETALSTGQEFVAGGPAVVRCKVHGVKSLAKTVPLPGALVDVRLRDRGGHVFPLHSGKTGADGQALVEFRVPNVAAGQYTLVVATRSALGEEQLERNVQIKTGAKILLVTDKPLYQPGQVMHLRALVLRPMDLKPVAGSELTFEVEDAKGNKVFKRAQRTSDYGIAALDFQLADEVNMGDYHVRALLGDYQADKTVAVKRYVLPKFKVKLTAAKPYYLPKETVHAEVQVDYFFGKPVAAGKIQVSASTFDVQFRQFQTWEGKTDAQGHATFDIQLPDYFVGQPLQKGNALVRLEAKLTDTADHAETAALSLPVSDQPIRVSLIPEGGRLVPGMENRVFAAAIYPDGSPAACAITLWIGREAKGKPLATVQTNAAGLSEFRLTPTANQFHPSPQWENRPVEMLGGPARNVWAPRNLFDLVAEAKDAKGNTARAVAEVNGEPLGENIVLRVDKAVYRAGDALAIDIRSSAGLPTAYLDVVRTGQTVLTRWLDVKDGKAAYHLDLPADVFGTVEVHAYQPLASGEVIRDSRVVYVQPREDLKVEIKPDKQVYTPGAEGRLHFQVMGADGKPAAAALGVIIVDESVYALQDLQPGLEKVYFTLQEELLKPQTEVLYRPSETMDSLVRHRDLPLMQQEIAEVLLTAVKPKAPARWEVAPEAERQQKMANQVQQIGWAMMNYATNNRPFMDWDPATRQWHFKQGLLDDLVQARLLDPALLKDPWGGPLSLDSLGALERDFTVEHLARAVTYNRMHQVFWTVVNYSNANQAKWFKNGKWTLPDNILSEAAKAARLDDKWLKDAWGEPIRLGKRSKNEPNTTGWPQFDAYELVSAGPDRKLGTRDDVKHLDPNQWHLVSFWWLGDSQRVAQQEAFLGRRRGFGLDGGGAGLGNRVMLRAAADGRFAGAGGAPAPKAARELQKAPLREDAKSVESDKAGAGAAAPTRVREYFPETLLWQPSLITDEQGCAELPVTFADSITTWRLSASASSRGAALGGVTAPLRVFQDFFVDLDLPVSLTQNDEVAFPVAVYNYLPSAQTVKLDLQPEPWFELADGGGLSRSLDLKANEVTSVKFRIRARRIGFYPLTVKATGSKMSDAIKRVIEIVPDGQKVEQVVTDRLTGHVAQTIDIPPQALADASKLVVKIYPGVFSQVLEGTEGLLRLPGG
jgi:hypothetical protein